MHPFGVLIIGETKSMSAVQPAVVGVTTTVCLMHDCFCHNLILSFKKPLTSIHFISLKGTLFFSVPLCVTISYKELHREFTKDHREKSQSFN
ncbi:hypothetical protein JCM15548_13890 [Geofilum rubicundum JCM 15548]|uniref:Uncharacterized protein n=1 Tax=Geofilum rubicundum JCM 15548 TaxID=1236989 RepID=A0A0E9M142_9BACT|nr:hypothetical protein JCM15548_13890 [Geofilum rubicundum JCM 15548]